MDAAGRLGEYLRARRELVRPADVGLPDFGRRRVPGLRREELAMLAGISADYYVRLEQGRDHHHPSGQVLDALACALQLDDHAAAHLHELARPAARRRRPRRPERAQAGAAQLVASWTQTPAFVQGRLMDVLAANPLATSLSPIYAPGVNIVRAVFLDPGVRERFRDWERRTENTVAALRALVGPDLDDPALTALVGELSLKSERFRRLWARHDVRPRTSGTTAVHHPQVGVLELRCEKLAITGSDRQVLVAYHAEPGSASARGLVLLASLAGDAASAATAAAMT